MKQVIASLKDMRFDAVALINSFDFSDYLLNSALTEKNSEVYMNI